jgi:mannose-6-phosphate isomerase-like protein (cupin superfamily)
MRILVLASLALIAFQAAADEPTKGYVLKVGDGEFAAGAIIKASPKTGSNGAVLIHEPFPDGFSTGLHYHVEADEFFYVISGTGFARFGEKDHPVEPGDVIFIPAGEDHKLFTNGSEMELLAFLDKPGLDEEFRAWHREYGEAIPVSLEQLNNIAEKYGTVYKTLE